jgi:hypothetical protein
MTFGEWTSGQERLGRTTQYVLDRGGQVEGWLRVAGDGEAGRFDLLAAGPALDDTVGAALAKVANRRWTYVLVPDYQEPLARRLDALGFEACEEYTVLARRTVRPVKVKAKVPAVIQTTFG